MSSAKFPPLTDEDWAEHLRATGALGTPLRTNWPWVVTEAALAFGALWGLRKALGGAE